MFKEFKEFAMHGNVLDMAVGIIIGAAFGKIITSFVSDILMPPIGLMLGKMDFANMAIILSQSADGKSDIKISYGVFFNTIIDFLLVAFVIFLVIKQANRMKKAEPASAPAAPTTKNCPYCIMEIPLKATRCGHCTAEIKLVS